MVVTTIYKSFHNQVDHMTKAINPSINSIKWNTMGIEYMTKLLQRSVIIGGIVSSKESYTVL